jgi:DNA-binding protein YbaB
MFNPFGALGDIQKLQQQAKKMQEELKKETVQVDKHGVRVVVRGDQQVLEIEVDGVMENRIADAVNEAIKKTQEVAARKLMEMSQNK